MKKCTIPESAWDLYPQLAWCIIKMWFAYRGVFCTFRTGSTRAFTHANLLCVHQIISATEWLHAGTRITQLGETGLLGHLSECDPVDREQRFVSCARETIRDFLDKSPFVIFWPFSNLTSTPTFTPLPKPEMSHLSRVSIEIPRVRSSANCVRLQPLSWCLEEDFRGLLGRNTNNQSSATLLYNVGRVIKRQRLFWQVL